MKYIGKIHSDFGEKFGIPRQSGLVNELQAAIVLEPEFRHPDIFRGLEGFSHIWLIWEFSDCKRDKWSATVRPPKLGGDVRMGVFATRSPFRPNPIGLSCVRLDSIEETSKGPVLHVLGADLKSGTPILDIKPYVPYADCHPDATGGFTTNSPSQKLQVYIPEEIKMLIPDNKLEALTGVLSEDPRPPYHDDPEREYGFVFANMNVKFKVASNGLLQVISVYCLE